jgi:chemotaxis protein CheX
MNLQQLIVDSIGQSVTQVFSTMLGVEIRAGEASLEHGTPEANDGVVSFIGVAGAWTGTGSLACSSKLACRICSHMLMTETLAINEEVLDAVAEVTNMIIGCVKTDLEPHLGPLGLSLPTVVFGRNFRTKSTGSTQWNVVRFPWEDGLLLVKLCLAPNERAGHAIPHAPGQACALEV